MRAPIALLAVVALLAACEPEAPGGGTAPPPADAPVVDPVESPAGPDAAASVFGEDFVLIGTEPFWRLDVKGGELSLARPDAAAVLARNAGLAVSPTGAIWTGQSGDQSLVARVTAGACSDGMSDRSYPYQAEVALGDLILRGCGVTARALAAMPPA
ncbi:MAG: hypothetical protein QE280_07985 [Caulobacter sp.]|nr:hypothetical protein [Caulobacter sp.]